MVRHRLMFIPFYNGKETCIRKVWLVGSMLCGLLGVVACLTGSSEEWAKGKVQGSTKRAYMENMIIKQPETFHERPENVMIGRIG